MVNAGELLKPNGFNISLCLLTFILLSMITVMFIDPSYDLYFSSSKLDFLTEFILETWAVLLLILVISYLFGASADYYVSSKKIKYMIIVFLGLATIISIYITYKLLAEPVICDPVHVPSQTESYNINLIKNIKIDEDTVKDSFHQCLQNLKDK